MARCYLTGVEIPLDEAFVLDLTAAHQAARDLKEKLTRVERLVSQLGATDPVPIAPGLQQQLTRRDRRVVSASVARVLGEACPERALFIPFRAWRARGRALFLGALRHHPDYGATLQALADSDADALVALGEDVLRRLFPGQRPAADLRLAVIGGICATLRDRPAESIAATVRERLATGQSFQDLGVPAAVEPALRSALDRRAASEWGVAE
jgi:hypothetical protein